MTFLHRPTAANKASAAIQSRRANARRRHLEIIARLYRRLKRPPTKAECNWSGVHFSHSSPFRTRFDALAALGIDVKKRVRGPNQPKLALLLDPPSPDHHPRGQFRHCDACDQMTPWSEAGESCRHCGGPWVRTRRAA